MPGTASRDTRECVEEDIQGVVCVQLRLLDRAQNMGSRWYQKSDCKI